MSKGHCRLARFALATLAFVMLFALFANAAFAASTYYDQNPAVGGTCAEPMPRISVKVSDPAGISGGYQIKLDGVTKSVKYKWGPGNAYVELYYQMPSTLANGNHTVYASVLTAAGRTSTTWTFNQRVAPVIGPLTPADGTTVNTQKPTISAVVNSGSALSSYAMTVDGAAVSASYDAGTKTISYTPFQRLTNNQSHTVTLTATDAGGASTSVTWSFFVQIYASMVDTQGCTECHTTYPTAHPMSNCDGCHAGDAPFPAYWNMDNPSQYAHSSSYLVGIDCAYCHASQFPSVPRHPANIGDVHQSATNMGGCSCHVGDLTIEHTRYKTDAGEDITCASCHASTDPVIQAGMAAGTRLCADCHTIGANHPYGDIDHIADVGEIADLSGKKCSECHEMDLLAEHEKPASSSAGTSCGNCHEFSTNSGPADTLDGWNQTCTQGGCHAVGSPTAMHANQSSAHVPASESSACTGGGCHSFTDVAALHSAAATEVAGASVTSCSVCHRNGVTLTKDCATCHPDRLDPHGYDPVDHTATDTASLACAAAGCHDTAEAMPIHAELGCKTCHGGDGRPNLVTGKTRFACVDCHTATGVDYHVNMAAKHIAPVADYETCGHCHHGWGSNPTKGPDITRHSSCATCHNATTDLTGKTAHCDDCHKTMGTGTKPEYFHQQINARHTPQDSASLGCARCHDTTNVYTLHGVDGCANCHETYGCSECHSMHYSDPNTALARNVSCANCHNSEGTNYHAGFATKHTNSSMASGCQASGCHSSSLVTAHAAYVGTGKRYPQYTDTCALCHLNTNPNRIPANATADCSSCHSEIHGDIGTMHQSSGGADNVSVGMNNDYHGTGDMAYFNCSDCHITDLLALHVNNCDACHASSNTTVTNAVTAGNTNCTACHPSQHDGEVGAHYAEYDSSNYDCGWCHGSGCYCHAPHTPVPDPTTTSDAKASYEGTATITLTAVDGDAGAFGIKATYYKLDGGPQTAGKTITVPQPASGSAPHTLEFWSTDYSGLTETHKTASFTVAKDTAAPTTTSDAKSSYVGPAKVKLTATDGSMAGVQSTYYTLDGGATQTGTTVSVPQPASGTVSHTLQFWSKDFNNNTESPKTATFTSTADLVKPVSTMTTAVNYRDSWKTFYFTLTDAAPSSGVPGFNVLLDGAAANVWGPSAWGNGTWQVTVYTPSAGNHTLTYWATDAAGNAEVAHSSTILYDPTAPTTTNNGASSYTGAATFQLTATDNVGGSGVANTYWRLSTSGSWTTGTTVNVAAPASGTVTRTVYYYSTDLANNQESLKTKTFTQSASGPDLTAPTGTMSVNSGATHAGTTSATMNSSVTDNVGVTQMCIDPGTGAYGAWQNYAASVAITLPTGSGTKTVRAQYRDAANNVLTLTDTIVLDTTAPTGTISVNAGAAYTNSTAVTLTLSSADNSGGSGVTQMCFSNDGVNFGAWETYAASKSWAVTSGDGNKTVSVKFRDAIGNSSITYADDINFETVAPVTTSNIVSGQEYSGSKVFALSPTDAKSGVANTYWQLDSTSGSWMTGVAPTVAAPASGSASHTLYWYSRDNAGNTEATQSVTFSVAAAVGTTYSSNIRLDGTAWYDAYLGAWGGYGTYWIYLDGTLIGTKPADGSPDWICPQTPITGAGVITISYDVGFTNEDGWWDYSGPQSASFTLPAGTSQLNAGIWTGFNGVRVADDWYDGYDSDYTYVALDPSTIKGVSYLTTTTDTIAPAGSLDINWGGTYTTATSIYVLGSATDVGGTGVSEMRFSNDGSTWGAWMDYTTLAQNWTVPTGDGSKTVYVQFRDAAGNISSSATDTILVDTTAPTGTVTINGGAATTNTTAATLTLSASDGAGLGVWQMRFSNNGTTWSAWEAYATSKAWTLAAGDGAKTVYVQFRDSAYWTSGSFTDTITLSGSDLTAPTGTMSVNSGAAYAGSVSATVNSAVTDNIAVTQMCIDPGTGTYGSWITYAASSPITLPTGSGTKTVRAQYRDASGNILTLTDTIVLDVSAPTGTMSVNGTAAYTNSVTATVTASVADALSGVVDMAIDPGSGTYGSWVAYTANKQFTLPTGDGTKTVRVQYRDAVGNILTLTDTIFLDATAPFTTASITAGQTYVGNQTFTLTPSDGTGSGVSGTWWQLDSTSGTWNSGTSVAVAAPATGTQTHTLYWYSKDIAGNSEVVKQVSFTMSAAAGGTATLAFRWEPSMWGMADLHVEDGNGNVVASTRVEGSGSDLNWDVQVPAGQNYYMVCDYYWDDDSGTEGYNYGYWTGLTVADGYYEWWY